MNPKASVVERSSFCHPGWFAVGLGLMVRVSGWAQVLMSAAGGGYTQDFSGLASSGNANVWTDNSTLSGWYVGGTGSFGGDYRAGTGTSTTGDLYSFGSGTDRALGSLVSATTGDMAYGVRLRNDTSGVLGNITVGFTGEQWRDAGTTAQKLSFSYQVGGTALVGADPGHLPGTGGWVGVAALDFISPRHSGAGSLDGTLSANRQIFGATSLPGVQLQPGQELFLRWLDANDAGNDHAFAVDNVSVSYSAVPEPGDCALVAGLLVLGLAVRSRSRSGLVLTAMRDGGSAPGQTRS